MTNQEHQSRGLSSYAAVTSGLVAEPSPDYSGRTFEARGGQCVVLDRQPRGAQLWRVRQPDGRIELMRPSELATAATPAAVGDEHGGSGPQPRQRPGP
jgi:hypothetical protein